MYTNMDEWMKIRRQVLVEGISKREVLRDTGMHWTTLEKILEYSEPPGYRRCREAEKPKIGPHLGWVEEVLKADQGLPRKQRHTAKRLWRRLRDEKGFTGGYTIVKDAVRTLKAGHQERFVPLVHRPGEAQVDFGQALVRMSGVLRKVFFFVMALPHSDGFFVMAFERECTESFWEGHVRAFAFFGGVARRITYDNTKVAVSKIVGSHARRLTRGFQQLVSHYLFDYHFCQVRRANEKGVVEGTVKFARLQAPPLPPEVVPGPAGREGQGPESRPAPVAAARLRQGQGLDPQIPQITQMEGRGKQRIKGSLCAVFLFFLICVICEICGCLFDGNRSRNSARIVH